MNQKLWKRPALWAGVALGLLLLAWLWVISPAGPLSVRINSGEACFWREALDSDVKVSFTPGCYSSSCTRALDKSGELTVDSKRMIIQFATRFVLRDLDFPKGSRGCTLDCGGGGSLQFVLTDVVPGTYTIWFGRKTVGDLRLPLSNALNQRACFDDRPKPPPTATYAGPTRTPAPIPTGPTPIPYPMLLLTPSPTAPRSVYP